MEDLREILTDDDILYLKNSPQFDKVIKHMGGMLDSARNECDFVKPDGLSFIQGRITILKYFIQLFGDVL